MLESIFSKHAYALPSYWNHCVIVAFTLRHSAICSMLTDERIDSLRGDMSIFWISIGMGMATVAILALSSVTLTLEYAVSRVVNMAHGEILTIAKLTADGIK